MAITRPFRRNSMSRGAGVWCIQNFNTIGSP